MKFKIGIILENDTSILEIVYISSSRKVLVLISSFLVSMMERESLTLVKN